MSLDVHELPSAEARRENWLGAATESMPMILSTYGSWLTPDLDSSPLTRALMRIGTTWHTVGVVEFLDHLQRFGPSGRIKIAPGGEPEILSALGVVLRPVVAPSRRFWPTFEAPFRRKRPIWARIGPY